MAAPTGILFPMPRLGSPITSGLQAFFYAPGTTTKQNTYTTSALSVANSNPLVADANGLFSAVYLDPALGYKIVLAPATDTDPPTSAIYSQDNAYLPAASYLFSQVNQFRLSLTSATPVTRTDVSAATTLYWTPYAGNRVALYSTTKLAWELFTSAEISITLVGLTASTPYDVFVYNNAGTPTLELTAWTSATARATALTTQDGVLVKTGATTRRFVGSVYVNASGGQSDDTAAKRTLGNYYNRVRKHFRVTETADSYTYTTATIRQANGTTANQVEAMICWDEVPIDLRVLAACSNGTAAVAVMVAIGEDSTTTLATETLDAAAQTLVSTEIQQLTAGMSKMPAVGRHTYTWLEFSGATGTTTWYGDNGNPTFQRSGLYGWGEF